MSTTIEIKTTPHDVRFPNTNQAQHCWTLYNTWVLCAKKDVDSAECKQTRRNANSICPNSWMEKWDEELAEGRFAGVAKSLE